MKEKAIIGKYGLFSTIVVTIVGVSIFYYPRDLTNMVNTDGWFVTILNGILTFLLVYITYMVIKINNFQNFNDILENNLGKILGKILAVAFAFGNLFFIATGMRIFIEVIKVYLLEKTPAEFILIIMLLAGTYLVRGEIESLVKFNEVSFWIMFIPIGFILIFLLGIADFTNIFPMFNNTPQTYVNAVLYTKYSFEGFSIIYLILPFLKQKKGTASVLFKSIGFVTLFYILIVVFCLAIFSKEQTKILLWPTITMIKSLNLPGTFVEHWEGVVMALWVIFYFANFVNIYYFSSHIIRNTFKFQDAKISSLIIIPAIYLITMYPQNLAEVYKLRNKYMVIFSTLTYIVLPLILILVGSIRKIRRKNNEN